MSKIEQTKDHIGSVVDPPLNFNSRRSVVYGTHGIVASSQPLACEAGLEILRKGGNAADAAVATAVALNVTEPCSCGIGGDCFILYYDNKTKKVSSLNGSGRSPQALTLEKIREMGITGKSLPLDNLNSVTVPGAVDAFIDTLHLFGSGKVSLSDVFNPAIRLAEEGYPVSQIVAYSWKRSENLLKQSSDNGNDMLRNGKAPKPGEIMKMPNLAKTFREIVDKGRDGFYKGYVAQAIVELIQSKGGLMTLEDLSSHKSTSVQPISILYDTNNNQRVRIWECPPNGQGIVALMALGILEQMQKQNQIPRLETLNHNSSEYLHALIEALRLAFSDGCYFVTDPDIEHIPIEELLSSTYLAKRAQTFHSKSANTNLPHGNPVNSSDTVYFSVTDSEGNACSFIFSNYTAFGSGAIPKNCGFTLQNRGCGFSLEEGHPNCIAGGKRAYHTIIPSMITYENGDLLASYGVMGAFMQPQGHLQILCNLLHHKMDVQSALDAPRFCIGPNVPDGTRENASSEISLEDGIGEQVIEELKLLGHHVKLITGHNRAIFGRGQIIVKVPNDENRLVWAAGSDPRADGHAAGW
jgi:gamma-glutamyltranspeptidase/glutathione hydrolase